MPTNQRSASSRVVAASSVGVAAICVLSACATQSSQPIPTFADGYSPGVRGSIVPVPSATPTSYDGLGPFGKYARAIDTEYRAKPDFVDWDTVADQNCSTVGDGRTEEMFGPTALADLAADSTIDSIGNESHPVTGRVWAASLTARCPWLITSALRAAIHDDQTGGLAWIAKQR